VCDGTVPSFIACNGVGADCPASGYQGNSNIRYEGAKIIPDGLLTPGSHVEYFFRREDGGVFKGTVPDTTVVSPQRGGNSTDGDLNNPDDNRLPDPSDHYGGLPSGHGYVAAHGGQPGYRGRWDMYQVRASESLMNQAGGIGSKLANSNPGNILDGYRSHQGATPDQPAYYKK